MRHHDVVIVGAGQAGLATSYWLTQRGIDHVVLERGRVGESWRSRRWDSFALNAPNWAFRLPGYAYEGPEPDGFMLRDQLANEFEGYAGLINAPVEEQVEVSQVKRNDDGTYFLATTAGAITSKAVVAATGAYQRRHRAPNDLDPSIVQIDTDQYRNADALEPGGVLVIGSGQSGCQVAEDLLENGRQHGWRQAHAAGSRAGTAARTTCRGDMRWASSTKRSSRWATSCDWRAPPSRPAYTAAET